MSTIIFLKPLHFGRFSSFCCCHLFLWQEMTRHGESVYNRVLNKTFAVMLETMNSCLLRYYTWWEVGLFPQNSLQTDFLQPEHDALPEQDVASSAFFSYPFGGAVNPLWPEQSRILQTHRWRDLGSVLLLFWLFFPVFLREMFCFYNRKWLPTY